MLYIVYYVDDDKMRHMTFVKTYQEVLFIQERFGAVTVESYNVPRQASGLSHRPFTAKTGVRLSHGVYKPIIDRQVLKVEKL